MRTILSSQSDRTYLPTGQEQSAKESLLRSRYLPLQLVALANTACEQFCSDALIAKC